MKSTDKFKQYLLSIIDKVDREIIEELMEHLVNVTILQDTLVDYNSTLQSKIMKWYVEHNRDEEFAEYFHIRTMREGDVENK